MHCSLSALALRRGTVALSLLSLRHLPNKVDAAPVRLGRGLIDLLDYFIGMLLLTAREYELFFVNWNR